jgi:hypothetical protein
MDLLLLFLVFAALGYVLGITRFGRKADRATEQVTVASKRLAGRLGERWKTTFEPRAFARDFKTYATSPAPDGADSQAARFPADFKTWLSELSERELADFVKSLADYSRTLGYNLSELVEGGLDSDPRLRQVFVEAITVYSSAYRKARQARQKAEAEAEAETTQPDSGNGKIPAEKASSRRKSGEPSEPIEAASTD